MEQWKRTFVEKLGKAKGQWVKQFEERMDAFVTPAFEDLSSFVREHGFQVSTPLQDEGRRSFKFELAENAYLLVIFRSTGVGEFELRVECFVPGREPNLHKSIGRLVDVDRAWASRRFESGLDKFVELLGGSNAERAATEEMVAV